MQFRAGKTHRTSRVIALIGIGRPDRNAALGIVDRMALSIVTAVFLLSPNMLMCADDLPVESKQFV